MFRKAQNFCVSEHRVLQQFFRNLTSAEISTALRPFYFSVHPDLFGQHPDQRATNETSLQTLSSILENLQRARPFKPVHLEFYVRDKLKVEDTQSNVRFRLIKISLKDRDIRSAIINILKSCQLPTDYIESVIKLQNSNGGYRQYYNYQKTEKHNTNDFDFTNEDTFFANIMRMKRKVGEVKGELKLDSWLRENFRAAREKSVDRRAQKEEISRLSKKLLEDLGLKEIKWECGWNNTHFRGCLLAFKSLVEQHPEYMHWLRDRILVFSYFTGVSLDGHVMLYSGEVRNNWLDFIKNIKKHDEALMRIPAFEKSLSHILRNIKIGRRKFMPKVSGGEYEKHLTQITTSLSDYFGCRSFPKDWPDSLGEYEIVVDNEAGPLMVSPTGQFIVPSTIPGTQLVSFISNNLIEAAEKASDYQSNKHIERSLCKRTIEELSLSSITKDDNITPGVMIDCCQRLLANKYHFYSYTPDLDLNIANYYSVLSDGVVCIPWNFKL